jgi:hypothetical protein
MLRTTGPRTEPDQIFWHVDKSYLEVSQFDEDAIHWPFDTVNSRQNVFIIPLDGNGTLYQYATKEQRTEFITLSENYLYYYGNTSISYVPEEAVNQMVSQEIIEQPPTGSGSIHIAGKDHGTIHASPPENYRTLLLIRGYNL